MEPETLKICLGTTCYIMGSCDLLAVEEYLPEEICQRITVEGATCLGKCKDIHATPPFIEIDGHIYEAADRSTVESKLREVLHADHK
ncbi:NAD(P)H-dependent oxidoreductase subunit E [Chitinivibrio alkaliphilus]|uniref:Fe-only hydrogenase, acessory subunit n=1 Tax=Chitinivibrio alkaliphilus ACht1 TaxID=1313304 RepID=U7DAA7_9BACT|nr:NAD(P)H-dependent oxidoreductase subunit E [Chitinivibrio alkaliphilus]ERP32067.1 Fe-only hydrogenase, acessory subunit [Chitinivibrio alkaliphilus ACht1]